MARHLDLEEQEQLDQLKAFWAKYGGVITGALAIVLVALIGYNGYQWWQRDQATKAAALFDEVERMVATGDATKIERAMTDMRSQYGGTALAQQAALLGAKALLDQGKTDAAKAQLQWVAIESKDDGYQAVAKLRLAAVHLEAKAFDEASKTLAGPFPPAFSALAADRRGDVLMAQNKREEAKTEYEAAFKGMDEQLEYRRLVLVKLNALGADPTALLAAAAAVGAAAVVAPAAVAPASVASPASAAAPAPAPVASAAPAASAGK